MQLGLCAVGTTTRFYRATVLQLVLYNYVMNENKIDL